VARIANSFDPPFRQQLADNFEDSLIRDPGAERPFAWLRPLVGNRADFASRGFQFESAETPGLKHLNDRTGGFAGVGLLPDPLPISQSQFD
jgi:hypothetical protein